MPSSGTTTSVGSTSGPGIVTREGSQLLLDGRPWRFTGFNAFGATTWWGVNYGCGSPVYDLDRMFNALPSNGVVRTWAFQSLAWNNKDVPQHRDWTAIDRVVQAAERTHRKLILTLSDQAGTCDDGSWHDPAWYFGGYKNVTTTDGRVSYADYVKEIVTRYKDSPAILAWEPVNEAEGSTCTGAAGSGCWNNSHRSCDDSIAGPALRQFFDNIGGLIHSIDPNHLVSSGLAGQLECGVDGGWHRYIGQSPGIDLLSYHDYSNDVSPAWLTDRLSQAHEDDLDKPLMVGEAGVSAGGADGCRSSTSRAALLTQKIDSAWTLGAAGYLPWWYSESPSDCGDDFGVSDPLLGVLGAKASQP